MKNLVARSIVVLLIVLAGEYKSFAQPGPGFIDHFVFRNWDNQSGLPQNTVNDLTRDASGYLWAATEEGLIRFDGSLFHVKNESNTEGLHSSVFYDISSGGEELWASSRNTIVKIFRDQLTAYDLRNQLEGGWITCIEYSNGKIFAGTSTGHLMYLQENEFRVYDRWDHRKAGYIEEIRFKGQEILVASTKGLFRLDTAQNITFPVPELKGTHVTCIISGNQGIWAGTAEKGLFYFGSSQEHYTIQHGLKENFINSLGLGPDGSVWIGTRSSGFQVLHKGKFITPNQDRFAHDGIRSFMAENPEEIWMGSTSSGLIQLKPAQILMLHESYGVSESIILPVYQHASGDTWIGTAGKGLRMIRAHQAKELNMKNGLSDNLVLSIGGDNNFVYIGTSNGLNRYNLSLNRIDKKYFKPEGLTTNSIQVLYNDSSNRLWIATRFGGMHVMENGIISKPVIPSLENTSFITVCEGAGSELWFGSRGAGAVRRSADGKFTVHNSKSGFPADIVFAFHYDSRGILWMGTEKGLLAFVNDKTFLFDKNNGLRFNEIYRVLEDDAGYLWLSGNFGLQRIPVKELQQAVENNDSSIMLSVRLFNTTDGMANAETNGGFHPAGWKMQNGELWFPTVKGIAVVKPSKIRENQRPMAIHLESLRFGGEVKSPYEKISLKPGTYNIEISYSSIDFSKAEDTRYYYRLIGLDERWVYAGNRKTGYFSGLNPGNYRFEVKAEQYGKWSPVAVMHFQIQPHFYQTTWFRLLMALIVLVILIMVFRFQRAKAMRKIHEQKMITKAQLTGQEKERQIIGVELHDNINQQLATAKLYLDYARSSEDMRLTMVEKSEKVVQNVINEIRMLCRNITPPTLKDIGLNDALQELLTSYTSVNTFTIHYENDAPLDGYEDDVRFTIYRIMQELMNNITRHACAKNVWIVFEHEHQVLKLRVKDDGNGFDTARRSPGLGLSNISNRLALYNGNLEINSKPGLGTEVRISLQVQNTIPARSSQNQSLQERSFPF